MEGASAYIQVDGPHRFIPFGSIFCLVADQAEVKALLASRPNARNSRCSGGKMEILENEVQSPVIPEANGFISSTRTQAGTNYIMHPGMSKV